MSKLMPPRFSAKLLFQYRVGNARDSKFRTCEERIVTLLCKTPISALREAKKVGKASESSYFNDAGTRVFIEFVGVLDFMEIGIEADENCAWYEIKSLLQPMERKAKMLPAEADLLKQEKFAKI